MRGSKWFLCLVGMLLLSTKSCNGLCELKNGTMARCHDLEDAKYIDTYDLKILKTSVTDERLRGEIFHKLASLRNLDISHGEIEHIEPVAFRELLDLRSLDLSHNKIATIPSKLFDGLTKLRSLNLRWNAFVKIPDAVLAVKALRSLDLIGNPLNCNCATMKTRDALLSRGVHLSKKILCSSPPNLKGSSLLEPEVRVICMFEDQDKEMQMDQPEVEGSGEASPDEPSDDPPPEEFDETEYDAIPEVSVTPISEPLETPAPEESARLAAPASSQLESSTDAAPSSSEIPVEPTASSETLSSQNDKGVSSEANASTKSTDVIDDVSEEAAKPSSLLSSLSVEEGVEGSGEEEEVPEGSGIEESETAVPPINWDVPDDETPRETSSPEPASTTDAGLLDMLWGVLWSTSTSPEDETKTELNPEDEEFIHVSSEATPVTTERVPVQEKIVPSVITTSEDSPAKKEKEEEPREDVVVVGRVLDDAKSGQVKAEVSSTSVEATDASATRQSKKGMGSYVVLAALLVVLGVLIGFAAYKGDFCRKTRKRNDPERGTELKDMTKSLLDSNNANQPKISSNGNLENVPLVSTPPQDDATLRDGKCEPTNESLDDSRSRYSGMPPEVVDPIKPPRKSYGLHEELDEVKTNDSRSQQDLTKASIPSVETNEPVCLRNKPREEPMINGKKHHRDSASSLGTESRDSPSIRTSPRISSPTNDSLGTLQGLARPPLSPGAQRVKITLQENPDSVPRTPILITRTKTGENLVKTP